jgi:3D (Asp-Asp-Asp) domain-containing protein
MLGSFGARGRAALGAAGAAARGVRAGYWRLAALALALVWPFLQLGPARADGAPWQWMTLTAFCDGGYMADGSPVHDGAVAAGWDIPFGSLVEIDGMGVYVVEDRGSAIGPGRLDVWMPSCGSADYFGRQVRAVRIQRWGWWGA